MKEQILNNSIELVFTILTTIVVSVLLPAVKAWLQSKTDNERIKSVISDITSAVATCVDHAEQTMVATLKKQDHWDDETKTAVRDTVIENVINSLLDSTKAIIENNDIDIEALIAQHIEAYIINKKASEKIENNQE